MLATGVGLGGPCLIFGQTVGEIGLVGQFLGNGPWARAGGRWLMLLERDGHFELRETVVSSTRIKPVCGDVGFTVNAADAEPGTLLLRGFPAVKAGPIVAAFQGGKFGGFLLPGEQLDLSLNGDHSWSLRAFGNVRPAVNAALGEARITNYEIHMIGHGRIALVFSLARVSNDGSPRVLWAGDLDGDRMVDLFADLRGYPGHHYVLFLSSRARAGQLVAEAASLTTLIC